MAEKVTPLRFADGTSRNADGSYNLHGGLVTPNYADIDSQDTESALNIRSSIMRRKGFVLAGVLAGIGVGVLASLPSSSAEAADDRTPKGSSMYNPDAVRQIDDITQNPLDNPLVPEVNSGFGNLEDEGIKYVMNNSQQIIDNLDNTLPYADSSNSDGFQTHQPTSASQKAENNVSNVVAPQPSPLEAVQNNLDAKDGTLNKTLTLNVKAGSSVDGAVQEMFGLTPEESWSKTVELIDGDVEGYHFVSPGPVDLPLDEGDAQAFAGQVEVAPAVNDEVPTPTASQSVEVSEPVSQPDSGSQPESGQPTAASGESNCLTSDLKGDVKNYTENPDDSQFMASNPVLFHLENVSENPDCPNIVYVNRYGSPNYDVEGPNWVETQQFRDQIQFLVPPGTTRDEWVYVPRSNDCSWQIDADDGPEVRIPPTYDSAIAVAIVQNPDCAPTPTPEPELSATPELTPPAAECTITDFKGKFNFDGNPVKHMLTNPATGEVENVSDDPSCPNVGYVDIYATKQRLLEGPGWLENQEFVSQTPVEVKVDDEDGKQEFSVPIPNLGGICWYQLDLVREKEVKLPPYYATIDYGFFKDPDYEKDCVDKTPTPIPSPSPSPSPTATATPAPKGPTGLPITGSSGGEGRSLVNPLTLLGGLLSLTGAGMAYEAWRQREEEKKRRLAHATVGNSNGLLAKDEEDNGLLQDELSRN